MVERSAPATGSVAGTDSFVRSGSVRWTATGVSHPTATRTLRVSRMRRSARHQVQFRVAESSPRVSALAAPQARAGKESRGPRPPARRASAVRPTVSGKRARPVSAVSSRRKTGYRQVPEHLVLGHPAQNSAQTAVGRRLPVAESVDTTHLRKRGHFAYVISDKRVVEI